jgi:mono/diheme cytochrome c family protein
MMKKVMQPWMLLPLALFVGGCHTDMWVQPKHQHPYQLSSAFPDGSASRPLVAGTVARGQANTDAAKFKGRVNGQLVTPIPATLTIEGKPVDTRTDLLKVLKRGKERFHIFCSHCHGEAGDGTGMIAQRGLTLKRPPGNYHTDRLRKMPIGHFFDVMTHGFGVMYSQSARVSVDDRWAIATYIRALQMSQSTPEASLTPEDMKKWEEQKKADAEAAKPKAEGEE